MKDYPIPEFSDAEVAFGADQKHYLTREQMGDEFYREHHPSARIASALFFRGGSLEGHGLRFRKGIDRAKAARAIRALLCSFAPKHEVKIGTVGYALDKWCEAIPREAK